MHLTSSRLRILDRYEETWRDGECLERRDPWPSYKKELSWIERRPDWIFPDVI